MDKNRFKKAQERIIMDFENDKAYFEWVRLPDWKKYEGDRTPLDYQGYDTVCPEDKLKEEGEEQQW